MEKYRQGRKYSERQGKREGERERALAKVKEASEACSAVKALAVTMATL